MVYTLYYRNVDQYFEIEIISFSSRTCYIRIRKHNGNGKLHKVEFVVRHEISIYVFTLAGFAPSSSSYADFQVSNR